VTDPIDVQHGLGSLHSPDDDRDYPDAILYALAGVEPDAAPPPSYTSPAPFPPVYNQGVTPQCVAYGSGGLKDWQDMRDTGPFAPDFGLFFAQIGGTPNGAVPRNAMQRLLDFGYPPAVSPAAAAQHRIASYYRVPVDQLSIQQAILAFGPVGISANWHASWFRPLAGGVLPPPVGSVGGHFFYGIGYVPRGLVCVNSWGTAWGASGRFILPWAYLSEVKEVWKTTDVVYPKPPTIAWSLRVAAHASVHHSSLNAANLYVMPDKVKQWGPKASSADCLAPKRIKTTDGHVITAVFVPSKPNGAFNARWVHLGPGVTAVTKA
jgi:hypothetical protein